MIEEDFADSCSRIGGEVEKSINEVVCSTDSAQVRIASDADGFGVARLAAENGDESVEATALSSDGLQGLYVVSKSNSMMIEGEFGSQITVSKGEQ